MTATDCSDPKQNRRLARWLHEEHVAVQIYAHAAGVLGFSQLPDLTEAAFTEVMLPKVAGEAIFTESSLAVESCLLFSSTSSVWSQLGASHYSGESMPLTSCKRPGIPLTSSHSSSFPSFEFLFGFDGKNSSIGGLPQRVRELWALWRHRHGCGAQVWPALSRDHLSSLPVS